MAVASAGPYANNLHLASDIATPAPCHSIFTGQMLFVMSVHVNATSVNALKANSMLFEQRDKSLPVNSTHYVMFYLVQHDNRIVTIS